MGVPGITPACAGNTYLNLAPYSRYRDHPRLRGEYLNIYPTDTAMQGSPPLARGIRFTQVPHSSGFGITPACAGNTGWH